MTLGANLDKKTQCGATLGANLIKETQRGATLTNLAVTPQRCDEMKNVIKRTPPKITETIWVKPLFH